MHPPSNEATAIFQKFVELWNKYELWRVVLDNPIPSSLGAVVVLLVFILIVWSRLRNNRASLRKLLGQGYSEEKSLICAFGTSICVDDKSSRFAIVSPAISVLCTAEELVSVELAKNRKKLRHLVIETSNADVRRIDISSPLFDDDRLDEIQGRLMALQKQVKSAQDES